MRPRRAVGISVVAAGVRLIPFGRLCEFRRGGGGECAARAVDLTTAARLGGAVAGLGARAARLPFWCLPPVVGVPRRSSRVLAFGGRGRTGEVVSARRGRRT